MKNLLLIGILLIFTIIIVVIGLGAFIWSAKKTLIREESVWSAKGIPFRHKGAKRKVKVNNQEEKLLENISSITNDYLKNEWKEND